MSHSLQTKHQAITLRTAGYSIKEVAAALHIAVSTSSLWLRDVPVSQEGRLRMQQQAVEHRYRMSLRWNQKRADRKLLHHRQAEAILDRVSFTPSVDKLICAVLFWAEGSKTDQKVVFTNSDPQMIRLFLALLRSSYELDEKRLRACVHLHEYHDAEKILDFWSGVTGIPRSQFIKPYKKPHTGLRKKKDYKGCISIRYCDSEIACQLEAIYSTAFFAPAAFCFAKRQGSKYNSLSDR